MISPDIRKKYHVTIGIECHVQLKTKTKLFAGVSNDARDASPNTLTSHICLGLPGALPVLNEHAVELAVRAAFALNSKPQTVSKFDRKHYFYPDLPMGYQITQLYEPIILGGSVKIMTESGERTIGITRAHLEADAGKNMHPDGADYSLVDLNRAGTPLLEIVSEPDMHSPAEARAYAEELYLRMKFADVSDADLFHGNMRFDVNVSVSPNSQLGTRTETKNLNSFRSVERAAEYEITRQIELVEQGKAVNQETRGWNEAKQKTVSQRGKEEAHDYRYMPDPDLPPVILEKNYIQSIQKTMPVMPDEWRKRLETLGLDQSQIHVLLKAQAENEIAGYLPMLEKALDEPSYAKQLANWLVNLEIPLVASDLSADIMDPIHKQQLYSAVYKLLTANKLSSTNAKALISQLLIASLPDSVEDYAKTQGLLQLSNSSDLEKIVEHVLKEHPQAVEDIKNGEMKVLGFLVGQVMKASKGAANPQIAQTLIKKQLSL